MTLGLFFTLWVLLGTLSAVLTYGLTFAHFQREWPSLAERGYHEDLGFALYMGFMSFLLPVLILIPLMSGTRHGLKFK